MAIATNLAIPLDLIKITDSPKENIYLYCGKPKKVKKLEDVIGKTLVIDGKTCIITYPLNYLVDKGEAYTAKITYCLEMIKNVFLVQKIWEYKDGRIEGGRL